MNSELWPGLALLGLSLVLLMLVALAEAGVIARFRSHTAEKRSGSRLEMLQHYAQERQFTLSALALARNVTTVAITAIAVFILVDAAGHSWPVLLLAALGVLVGLTAFQALARVLALHEADRWTTRTQFFVIAVRKTFGWPARLIDLPVTTLLRALSHRQFPDEAEELVRLAQLEEATGLIPREERAMIRSIMEMEETTAREIMVPRMDIIAVDVSAGFDEAVQLIVEKGYSRIPVYEETIDNIIGVVHAKQVLRQIAGAHGKASIRDIMRPMHFIPETKRVDELLSDLRLQKVSIAVVVDEYGGTAGLVTLEDVVEEIVGEIADEFDVEEEPMQKISENEIVVDGKFSIDELSEFFGIEIERDDFDTVGGFVFNHLGKMPSVGDEIRVDELLLKVVSVLGRRIKKVRIRRDAISSAGNNGNGSRAKQAS